MADCAQELEQAVGTVDTCPAPEETVMFILPGGYVRRRWDKLVACIATQVAAGPDDKEVTISGDWVGRTYYDDEDTVGKRYRLFRDGILLNKNQWRPTATGWELLQIGDTLVDTQVFTISYY